MEHEQGRTGAAHHDALLTPTLGSHTRAAARPWRTGSIFYVAFFGGILPAAVLAWINAGRLPVPRERRLGAAAVGVLGLAATVAVPAILDLTEGQSLRLATRVVAVVAFGAIWWLLRAGERIHATFGPEDDDEAYASLWGPGLAATIGLGLVQAGLVSAILSAL